MENYKISVIVPVYKVESYLEQCISSIIKQTYKNLEIILVNDGSPDNCGKLCDIYAKKDSRIKVIHKKNGGLSDARNVALDIATGDYIGFVDSDDWININMYEVLINEAKNEDADIVECKFKSVYDRNIKIDMNEVIEKKIFNAEEAIKQHLKGKYFYRCVWNKIYKKELFKDIRFPYSKLAEDLYVTYKLFYKSSKLISVNFQGYYYYIRDNSIMGIGDFKLAMSTFEGIKEQHEFICSNLPKLKPMIDKLYINCLLKSYVECKKNEIDIENIKDIQYYERIITSELKRKDINTSGISKLAFILYKLYPGLFVKIMYKLKKEGRHK